MKLSQKIHISKFQDKNIISFHFISSFIFLLSDLYVLEYFYIINLVFTGCSWANLNLFLDKFASSLLRDCIFCVTQHSMCSYNTGRFPNLYLTQVKASKNVTLYCVAFGIRDGKSCTLCYIYCNRDSYWVLFMLAIILPPVCFVH